MRATIYTRVSSHHQEHDGASLDTQLAGCRSYCGQHGYRVVVEHTDTWTGTQYRERPGLTQLRALVRSGAVDVVLIYALDRLSRDQTHTAVIVDEIEHHGARLELVSEQFDDTPTGKFILSAKAFAAAIEHEKITERSTRGRRERASKGKLISRPKPLYGYRFRDAERAAYEVHEPEARVLRRIYAACLAGQPINRIRLALNADGIPSPRGLDYWSHSTIHRLLTTYAYTGAGASWRGEFALAADAIPPLVSVADYEAVQATLRHNKQFSTRNTLRPEDALLRGGFARCGHCGRVVQVIRGRQGATYRCRGHEDVAGQCPGTSMVAVTLDAVIWEGVVDALTKPELIADKLAQLMEADPTDADLASVDRRAKKVRQLQANAARAVALLDDDDAAAPLLRDLRDYAAELANLERERAEIGQRRAQWAAAQQQLDDLRGWCGRLADDVQSFTWIERRMALTGLRAQVTLYKASHTPRYELELLVPMHAPQTLSHTTSPTSKMWASGSGR